MEDLLAPGLADHTREGEGLSREEGLRRLLRFSLPHNATVILLTQETPNLRCKEHTVWPLALAKAALYLPTIVQ